MITTIVIHIIGSATLIAIGAAASFIFYSPEQRAVAKLEQLVKQHEKNILDNGRRFSSQFLSGATHIISRLKDDVHRIRTQKL